MSADFYNLIKKEVSLILGAVLIVPISSMANDGFSTVYQPSKNVIQSSQASTSYSSAKLGSQTLVITTKRRISDTVTNRDIDEFNPFFTLSENNVFTEEYDQKQIDDLRNIDYSSSVSLNGTEWKTRFDADNHYNSNQEYDYNLKINTFYISYKNDNTGISSRVGRQASPGSGVIGPIDGITLQAPLISRISLGASAGFPVSSRQKDLIQSNKPFVAFNAKIPGLYKSLVLKPYILMQKLDGFINRHSVGSEVNYSYKSSSIYQLTDYDIQFNELNMWLVQAQLQKKKALYQLSLDYRRNPALELDNALANEYRAGNLKDLSNVMSFKDMLEQASQRTARNYSAKLGSSIPLNSKLRLGADLRRRDQLYNSLDGNGEDYVELHNFQNEISTQLVASNLIQKQETLLLELGYVSAKYYTNTSFAIRNQVRLSGLYQLDLKLRVAEGERDNGELLLTTLPTATFTCQCSKRIYSELEVGYENWAYTGNTVQEDYSQVFANINFRMQL